MNPLSFLLASVLWLPVATLPGGVPQPARQAELTAEAKTSPRPLNRLDGVPFSWVSEVFRTDSAEQVSIEQHIIIRIAPRAPSTADPRIPMQSEIPNRPSGPHFKERNMSKCVPVAGIAGVQISGGNRLTLFMRDSRVVSAGLDKGCKAQDFYSGFYVQRSSDGMLCSGRDKLQSRSGASCKLGKLHLLVEVED